MLAAALTGTSGNGSCRNFRPCLDVRFTKNVGCMVDTKGLCDHTHLTPSPAAPNPWLFLRNRDRNFVWFVAQFIGNSTGNLQRSQCATLALSPRDLHTTYAQKRRVSLRATSWDACRMPDATSTLMRRANAQALGAAREASRLLSSRGDYAWNVLIRRPRIV